MYGSSFKAVSTKDVYGFFFVADCLPAGPLHLAQAAPRSPGELIIDLPRIGFGEVFAPSSREGRVIFRSTFT
jgi:hypothetical protein